MLESYRVKQEKGEDVLYLYFNTNYEFSKEFTEETINNLDRNWLCQERIQFEGDKIIILVDGNPIKTVLLDKLEKTNDKDVLVQLDTNEFISLHDFLLSLLLTNIKIPLEKEVLKAITILYRSEGFHYIKHKKKVKAINSHFLYTNLNYYKLSFPETYHKLEKTYLEVIKETDSEYITYHDEPIKAFIHLASNGYTETHPVYKYLKKKECLWDLAYPYYLQQNYFTSNEIRKKLKLQDEVIQFEIKKVTDANRVLELRANDRILTSQELMVYLNLPSSDITILVDNKGFNFITRGIGNGYGLSMIGANSLALLGCNYKQILGYFFDDVVLLKKEKS